MHNVYFVQYDAPVSKMPMDITCMFVYMIQGHIKGEIMDLEFENYKKVKKSVFSAHRSELVQLREKYTVKSAHCAVDPPFCQQPSHSI